MSKVGISEAVGKEFPSHAPVGFWWVCFVWPFVVASSSSAIGTMIVVGMNLGTVMCCNVRNGEYIQKWATHVVLE